MGSEQYDSPQIFPELISVREFPVERGNDLYCLSVVLSPGSEVKISKISVLGGDSPRTSSEDSVEGQEEGYGSPIIVCGGMMVPELQK